MAKFYHADGFIIDNDRINGVNEQMHVMPNNRWHKVYYENDYRADASPYIKINGYKYYLSEFLKEF